MEDRLFNSRRSVTFDVSGSDEQLPNPYLSPTETSEVTSHNLALPTKQTCLAIALAASVLLSLAGLAVHMVCGIPFSDAFLENQVWVLLLAALSTIACILTSNRFQIAGKFTCLIVGACVLLDHLYEIASSSINGTEVERFAFHRRVLGDYYWIYWAVVLTLGVLPLAFSASIIRRSSLASLCFLCIIAAVATFYLRSNFVVKYADSFPTSWYQFFWPF